MIRAERFAGALFATIGDPRIAALPPIGTVDQFADSTDLVSHAGRRAAYLNFPPDLGE